jgi:DNA-binding transcriptional ArsR family regulator
MRSHRELSPEALELVAARFRVLAEPVRLRLLQRLEQGECSVTELAELLETTQPNVSKHLKLLQAAGFVARRQEKNTAFYSIADPTVFELCDLVCARLHDRLAAQAEAFEPPRRAPRRTRAGK